MGRRTEKVPDCSRKGEISVSQTFSPELGDKRWFGFEIEYLLIARFFRIQYQNQYLFYLEVVTDIDINIVQWVIFEFETPFSFSLVGP